MSHWNYRMVKRKFDHETIYAIHEACYDDDAKLKVGFTKNPVPVEGESIESLRWILTKMIEALDKPVLDYDIAPTE